MGADAFFFDEYPGSIGGDWNPACQALYHARHGMAMPTDHVVGYGRDGETFPMSTSRNVLQLMSDVTETYFAELVAAIGNATTLHFMNEMASVRNGIRSTPAVHDARGLTPATSAVALVSTHLVPAPDDGAELYETTRLLSYGAQDVAKSEFVTGTLQQSVYTYSVACVLTSDLWRFYRSF